MTDTDSPVNQSKLEVITCNGREARKNVSEQVAIHRKKKDGGCTFYHNTLRAKRSPLGI